MPTAEKIIQDSVEQIGQYSPGETITAADANRALIVLNNMLSQWSTENLACFHFLEQSIPLANNQANYTIGPGGDVDGVRPIMLTQVWLQDSNGNKYNVAIKTLYDFNLLSVGQ